MSEEQVLCITDQRKVIRLSTKLYQELRLSTYHIDYTEFLEQNVEELDKVTILNVVERYTTFRLTQAWIVKYKDEYI